MARKAQNGCHVWSISSTGRSLREHDRGDVKQYDIILI